MDERILKLKARAEADLDELAAIRAQTTGEDKVTAYVQVCDTSLGRHLIKSIDDATALLTKGPTEEDMERLIREEKLRRKKKQGKITDKELRRSMAELK